MVPSPRRLPIPSFSSALDRQGLQGIVRIGADQSAVRRYHPSSCRPRQRLELLRRIEAPPLIAGGRRCRRPPRVAGAFADRFGVPFRRAPRGDGTWPYHFGDHLGRILLVRNDAGLRHAGLSGDCARPRAAHREHLWRAAQVYWGRSGAGLGDTLDAAPLGFVRPDRDRQGRQSYAPAVNEVSTLNTVKKVVWCEPAHTHKSAARPR
jgi:hypothetical protein